MVALSRAAGVALDGGPRGCAADAGRLVGGVAHARCGEFGEHRVEGRACFGGEVAGDRRHAVDVLAAEGDAAPPSPVVITEVAVRVEAVGEFVGQLGQLIRAVLGGQAGQLGFGFVPGFDIDKIRQPMPKAADHRDMTGTQLPVALRLGRRGQHRLQRFTVQRPPLAQIGGLVDAPGGVGAADPQPVGQHRGQLATQLGRVGLFGELIDQRVLDGRVPTTQLLPALQYPQPLGCGQHMKRQVQGAFVAGLERIEHLDNLFPTTRTHVRIVAKPADGNSPTNPRLWINAQLWIHRMLGCRPG